MKTEVFYTEESLERKINELRDSGIRFKVDVEFDYDVGFYCYVVDWED